MHATADPLLVQFLLIYIDVRTFLEESDHFEPQFFQFLQLYVDTLVKKAYENWMHVIEYDGKALLSFAENKSSSAPQSDIATGSQNDSNSFDYQVNLPSLPPSIPSEQPSISPVQTIGGI